MTTGKEWLLIKPLITHDMLGFQFNPHGRIRLVRSVSFLAVAFSPWINRMNESVRFVRVCALSHRLVDLGLQLC